MADLWHYTSEGKRMEPVTAGELRQLAAAGFLHPEDLVWKQGMTDWAPASSIGGLFTKTAAAAIAPAAAPAAEPATFEVESPGRRRRSEIDDDGEIDDAPRRKRRRSADDDSPRRRKPQTSSGPNWGLIIGLIVGGVFVLLVAGIAIGVAISRGGSHAPFNVSVPEKIFQTRDFFFKANTAYEFILTSDPGPDVDLYLTDLNGQILRSGNLLAADITIGPNGRIVWIFPVAGMYRVKVHNLGPQVCRSTVTIRDLGPGHAIQVPAFIGNPPINMPGVPPFGKMPKLQMPKMQKVQMPGPPGPVGLAVAIPGGLERRNLPTLGSGQECEFTLTYRAARQVTMDVATSERDPDVDLFVFEIGGPRTFSDESVGPDCHVTFQAQPGRTYRFVIRNVTPMPSIANSTIVYTSP